MRRLFAALSLLSLLAGCETSPIGGRCVYNSDCDRRTVGMTARCVRASNPTSTCGGGSSEFCVCCPIGADPNDTTLPTQCRGGTMSDAGTTETSVVDTGVDTGAVDVVSNETSVGDANDIVTSDIGTDTGGVCSCTVGQFCDTSGGGMMCVPQRAIGVPCGTDTECQTGHCVSNVCCNSACTVAGLSCNVSPDFAGLCTPIASTDAGTE